MESNGILWITNFALPMLPYETERVSLYHEEIKQRENQYGHLSEKRCEKGCQILSTFPTLADHQLPTFVNHHLGVVGNRQVVETVALLPEDSEVEWVTEQRRNAIKNERETKCTLAVEILRNSEPYTTHEIPGLKATEGGSLNWNRLCMNMLTDWRVLSDTGTMRIAISTRRIFKLLSRSLNTTSSPKNLIHSAEVILLSTIRNGSPQCLPRNLKTASSDIVNAGSGRELTAVRDDRFLGEVLTALLNRLKDEVFESDVSLANAIREVLDTVSNGQTLFGRIKQGGLGAQAYRRSRFLKTADDAYVINWARSFIKEYYPATLSKRKNTYSLVHDKKIELYLNSFKCWLSQRIDGDVPELARGFDAIEPQDEIKAQVRAQRKDGALLEVIAEEFDISVYTASEWCKDIKVDKDTVREQASKRRSKKDTEDSELKIRALQLKEQELSLTKIANILNISRRKLNRILEM